ncbi:MAG: threonine--tRNA ligase [Zetaproteobacteria bacterium]|nr:threonine--tRNA ligase [Zetaproteobacteria bacterium]
MTSIDITLPDGSIRSYEPGTTYAQAATKIHKKIGKTAIAVQINGNQILDLSREITQSCAIEFITPDTEIGLEIIRHSTAHVLAMAVQQLYPGTKVTIGPVIKDGFYYDFEFPADQAVGDHDLGAIEKQMKRLMKQNIQVYRDLVSRDEAISRFNQLQENYKTEIIAAIPTDENVTLYGMGDWFDLCRGPHVPNSNRLGHFKLMKVAGAYWRGNEKNKMLTRIYGTAWATAEELAAHLQRLEEAKKRDHRIVGKQLDLFSFHPEAPGSAFFHPKGSTVLNELKRYLRESNLKYGFQQIDTPLMMSVDLWKKSGHYENYAENMYFISRDDVDASIKPMNCPGHCLVYKSQKRSYRELPLQYAEFGRVHRHEKSGTLNGLFRVRTFVQDDAHVFCETTQIKDVVHSLLQQIFEIYQDLGFETYFIELSTRPEKSMGSDEMWNTAESILKEVLDHCGKSYTVNPGDGAFYGPKIDFHLVDALQRSWQCGTIQLDFSMPERFELGYTSSDNSAKRPVMLHRAAVGSLERFLAVLIEHSAGRLPLWLAPTQIQVIPVGEKYQQYAHEVTQILKKAGLRTELDSRNEKLGYKIREAQMQKIPYMLVLGEKEMESQTVSIRHRDGQQMEPMACAAFIQHMHTELRL